MLALDLSCSWMWGLLLFWSGSSPILPFNWPLAGKSREHHVHFELHVKWDLRCGNWARGLNSSERIYSCSAVQSCFQIQWCPLILALDIRAFQIWDDIFAGPSRNHLCELIPTQLIVLNGICRSLVYLYWTNIFLVVFLIVFTEPCCPYCTMSRFRAIAWETFFANIQENTPGKS